MPIATEFVADQDRCITGITPDASTICRFRNRLLKAELDQKLLALINGQLEQRGLKAQGARGATITPSAARPCQHVEGDGQQAKVNPCLCAGTQTFQDRSTVRGSGSA